jgi:hypothetical protein
MGKIKQLFRQPDNSLRLETCKQELNHALEIFKVHAIFILIFDQNLSMQVRATGSTVSQIVQMKKNAKQQHEELVAHLENHPDLTNFDRSSVRSCIF